MFRGDLAQKWYFSPGAFGVRCAARVKILYRYQINHAECFPSDFISSIRTRGFDADTATIITVGLFGNVKYLVCIGRANELTYMDQHHVVTNMLHHAQIANCKNIGYLWLLLPVNSQWNYIALLNCVNLIFNRQRVGCKIKRKASSLFSVASAGRYTSSP